MDQFVFMTKCLKDFNYPNIHGMDELEIADIFSKNNRQFLIAWILKEMDDDYYEIVENATDDDLAEMVHCNGFCKMSEKKLFLNGECEVERQLLILYQMFKYLKDVYDSKKESNISENVTIREVEDLFKINTNLFATSGPKQTFTAAQRNKKINEYREEIENLKKLLDSSATSQAKNESPDTDLKQQLQTAMNSFETHFPDFKRKALDVIKSRNDLFSEKIHFRNDFSKTLEACKENSEVFSEFIKSLVLITGFTGNNPGYFGYQNNCSGMMREIADLCNEILPLKRKDTFSD